MVALDASCVLVLGAARSGVAAAAALRRAAPEAAVRLADRTHRDDVEPLEGVELALGRWDVGLLEGVDLVVKSPGVPGEAPLVEAARRRGIPVWSEVELGFRLLGEGHDVIGVTGTNGKTTTTALCGAMLDRGGVQVSVGGNIGTALSTLVGRLAPGEAVVCELSSFQLEDVERFHAHVAVLLNVTPDHLDRHGTFERYAALKLRVFERQGPHDTSILNTDDAWVGALDPSRLPGRARRLCVRRADVRADLRDAFAQSGLRGDHNLSNAVCAHAAALAAGAGHDGALAALAEFQPLAHRLEEIAVVDGVRYIDDSKATNVEAAAEALGAFHQGVHVILGGSLKGTSFAPLAPLLAGRAEAAYLIGQAADALARDLAPSGVALHRCGTLEAALEAATRAAAPGDVVLLAPACASFDQFRDYEERGERFRALVEALAA